MHHIVPRCLGGSDDPDNLIELTLREHYVAHWMLWKAYPENSSVRFAFYAMCNKNFKSSHKKKVYQKIRHSRVYAQLKAQALKAQRELMTGVVRIRDKHGQIKELTSEEYQEQNDLKFHTKGMTTVTDTRTGERKWVTTQEYRKKPYYQALPRSWTGTVRTFILDGEEVRLSYEEYVNRKSQGQNIKAKFYGDIEKCQGTLVVYDHHTGENRKITQEQYYQDPARYRTATKGQVLARNRITGESKMISQELFDSSDEWVGQTDGLTTVRDTHTGQCVQVTVEQARDPQYQGLAAGKINAIHRTTGERKQIPKQDYDPDIWCPLGDRKMAFRCQCKKTGKQKNIYIYEWNRVKDLYEVLDTEQFDKLKPLLT